MRVSGFVFAALLFAALFAASSPAMARLFNAQTATLQNGMEIVVIPNHRAPVVTHMVWYRFGAADEHPGKSGIAHFLEHLMFKGTPDIPDGAFSRRVKQMGGNDNAFTSHDFTAYYQNVPKMHLAEVMRMEADRMKNLTLRDAEVVSERKVIIEERLQRIDNQPAARFREQVSSFLYINHPYNTPVIGWMHEMEHLTREDALEYYDLYYAPNNAILIISGDVTMADVKPLAEKYYGVIPPQGVPERNRPEPAPLVSHNRIMMQDSRVGQPVLTIVYRAPRASEPLNILAEIFGGTSTARLYKHLVVDKKLAISARSDYDPISLDDSSFSIYAVPAPGVTIAALEEAIHKQIKTLLEKGVTQDELDSARRRKIAGMTYYLDSLQGPAILFGRALTSGFTVDYLENTHARMERVKVSDINREARAVLAEDIFPVTGLLLPAPAKAVPAGGK